MALVTLILLRGLGQNDCWLVIGEQAKDECRTGEERLKVGHCVHHIGGMDAPARR